MRWGVLFAAATLGGCANTTDLGNSFSVTVTAFSGGITAENQLAVDLEKDFLKKSEQLEYISKGSYSCGNPKDPIILSLEKKARASILKVNNDAIKSLRTKNAYINAILGYGDFIAKIVKDQANLGTTLDKWSTAIATFGGLAGTPEAKLFVTAAQGIISDVKAVGGFISHEQIKAYAIKIQPHLAANVAYLIHKKNLRVLTAEEEQAYQLWKACAEERLDFERQFFPPTYGRERNNPYPSIAPSPVWDFDAAYGEYINEREAFIGRRPDFSALLTQIVTANQAIIEDKQDFIDVVNTMGATATTIKNSADGINKAAAAYESGK
jgi:hypothetical protein